MDIRQGSKTIKNGTVTTLVDIFCDDYVIYVFQGGISPNDIILKYKSPKNNRPRTPKHIHWAVDLLLKKENHPLKTNAFLKEIQKVWNTCGVLTDNHLAGISAFLTSYISKCDLSRFKDLDSHGEYPTEFLFALMSLLAIQEKTNATYNHTTAVMFGGIIEELLKDDLDIFRVMSTAGFGGR